MANSVFALEKCDETKESVVFVEVTIDGINQAFAGYRYGIGIPNGVFPR